MITPPADASHVTIQCIDVGDNRRSRGTIRTGELIVRLGVSDENHPPDRSCHTEDSAAGQDTEIDLEWTGVSDPDDSNSPESPDATCTVPEGEGFCRITHESSETGEQTISAWLDDDKDNATIELDQAEGYDEASTPGDRAEPDTTDVILWNWYQCAVDQCGTYVTIATTVTISFREHRYLVNGELLGSDRFRRCRLHRTVVIRKVIGDKAQTLGKTTTGSDTWWRFKLPRSFRGKVFARALRKTYQTDEGYIRHCLTDRSNTVRVR